jgi:3-isopropylmalate dehydrogenase
MGAARELLSARGEVDIEERLLGGASTDAHRTALTDDVLEAAAAPTRSRPWAGRSGTSTSRRPPSRGCSDCGKGLGLLADLRPVRPSAALLDASPPKRERIEGTDLLVVRELTGGIYFGDRGLDGDTAHDTCVFHHQVVGGRDQAPFGACGRSPSSVKAAHPTVVLGVPAHRLDRL